ncbi:hypothetical protein EW026_g1546 [Hermanssonia centrifuga]|uniref:RNA polymerase-associated protein CTR9-like protein n=1 Tax=Hermanssonia centrifuga TaxID=98765 RepID=A0A4S4KVS3_9APHY|nr:hypothetical protein EW026_g1546 [Hermanssonia centrifuga]
MNGTRSPSPLPGRSIDIELSGQEIITVDLENLDASPDDLLDLLKESQSQVWVWTKLATEYWRRGYLDAAEKLAQGAVEFFRSNGSTSSLPPIYSLLANIQLAHARKAPKIIWKDARQDDMRKEKIREDFYRESAQYLNRGEKAATDAGEGVGSTLGFLTRAILQLSSGDMENALRSFDGVLAEKPTNVVALLGKARILYARRQYQQSLRLFQDVLRYNPNCVPDPRVGIGLCLWAMDQKGKAKVAWERSIEVNPSQWPAQLLLGLEAINSSKNENQTEDERRDDFLRGTRLIEKAFNANQKNSAAANALCELFLRKGQRKRALKLAERTIQFADTLTVLTDGHIRAGRVLHEDGSITDSVKHYTAAKTGQPSNMLATIGLAQVQLKNDEIAAAIHTLDSLLQPPNSNRAVEPTVMLASLRAHSRPGVSSSDQAQEKLRARELFERVSKALSLPEQNHVSLNGHAHSLTRTQRKISEDVHVHTEIARLWYDEDLGRVDRALQEALRISESTGKVDPRLLNNLGVLQYFDGRFDQARVLYERALTDATGLDTAVGENMSTSILYNLARAYEAQGEDTMAKDAYDKLLSRHPEYVDAKIRQAHMLTDINRHNEAHDLLKQSLASQANNLNLRASYVPHFLIQSNLHKPAKDFVFGTLKDHDKHDVYSLCAAGWIQYHQARESRDGSPKGLEERKRGFQRSAEFYEKALQFDPMCVIAAQGLAIVTAEDALGSLGGSLGPLAPDEPQRRIKNAREALDVFAKVRESLDDGSVYSNMGHCYYASDEYDRAVESYETASRKFYHGHNVPVLLCLCRSWYAKANKDQSFVAMNTALRYAQNAFYLQPGDKAIMYNIAMIEQKAAEMLLSISPAKRTLKDLQRAIEQAAHAQNLLQRTNRPWYLTVVTSLIREGNMVTVSCEDAMNISQLKNNTRLKPSLNLKVPAGDGKKKRRHKKLLSKNACKSLQRRQRNSQKFVKKAREEALEWSQRHAESDEEKEKEKKKKPRGRARTEATGSADEGEPRKKRRGGKLKKEVDAGEEEAALFSGEEEDSKPAAKKRTKKRVVRDDDEEEEAGGPRRKQIKSREYISDSDEEMA